MTHRANQIIVADDDGTHRRVYTPKPNGEWDVEEQTRGMDDTEWRPVGHETVEAIEVDGRQHAETPTTPTLRTFGTQHHGEQHRVFTEEFTVDDAQAEGTWLSSSLVVSVER